MLPVDRTVIFPCTHCIQLYSSPNPCFKFGCPKKTKCAWKAHRLNSDALTNPKWILSALGKNNRRCDRGTWRGNSCLVRAARGHWKAWYRTRWIDVVIERAGGIRMLGMSFEHLYGSRRSGGRRTWWVPWSQDIVRFCSGYCHCRTMGVVNRIVGIRWTWHEEMAES